MTDIEKMYLENESLVYYTINKYYAQYLFDEDMQQIGRIALWRACERWEPGTGAFSTYAATVIKRAIQHEWVYNTAEKRTGDVVSLDGPLSAHVSEDYNGYALVAGTTDIDYLDLEPIVAVLDLEREKVLYLLMAGYSLKEIAEIQGCSSERIRQLKNYIGKVIRGEMSERQRKQAIRRRIKEQEVAGKGCKKQSNSREESQLIQRLLDSGAAEKIRRPGDYVSDAPRRPRGRPRKLA